MSDVEPKLSPMARRHRVVLIASALVVVSAFALEVRPDDRVAVRRLPWLRLPFACPLRASTGLPCPGCGLTRAMVHLAHGDLEASWRHHWLGIPLGLVLILQAPYRLLALNRRWEFRIPSRLQILLGYGLLAVVLARWLVEVWRVLRS